MLFCVFRFCSVLGEFESRRIGADDAFFSLEGRCRLPKGFERVANEAKASLEEKRLLEDENRKLREENERLKEQSRQLKDQSTKQQTAIDALKQELEKSLQCYE
jgi:hypothetical protein